MEGNAGSAGEGGQRLADIADEMICGRNDARQHRGDRGVVVLGQYSVEGRAFPVAGDKDGNVLLIGARIRAVPPRLRALRGRSDQRPLKESRMKVSSASTIPLKLEACRRRARAGTDAASGTRWSDGRRTVSRSSPGSCPRSSPGRDEPLLLLAQMRHGRSGQGVERASTTLAAESQQPIRAAPADDLATRAMRAAPAFHPLDAYRSQRVLRPAWRVAFPWKAALNISARRRSPAFASASAASPALLRAQARDRRQPTRESREPASEHVLDTAQY